jgi:hypothetical protein
MIKTEITCDRCGGPMEYVEVDISWNSIYGHNGVPSGGWQFHYRCASGLPRMINTFALEGNKPGERQSIEVPAAL